MRYARIFVWLAVLAPALLSVYRPSSSLLGNPCLRLSAIRTKSHDAARVAGGCLLEWLAHWRYGAYWIAAADSCRSSSESRLPLDGVPAYSSLILRSTAAWLLLLLYGICIAVRWTIQFSAS